ncbi:MAG: ABC transporter ATP-binding protein, partial [Clostridia bacterium]|nr:ABC transporter ATP-binding protein [Clostridia bacterium]
ELRITVRNLLSSLGRNKIVIVSTHIVSDIENIADHVILLKHGAIVANGTPSDLIREIDGKVWEVDVSADEASSIAEIYPVSSSKPISNSSFRMRVISNSPFTDNAYLVAPSLEDVYIANFAKNTYMI